MNESVENVSLSSIFVKNVLDLYKDNDKLYQELMQMTEGYDLSSAMQFVPIRIYNNICGWIENELGEANAHKLGRKIGDTAYIFMIKNKLIDESATPFQIMHSLKKVASSVIKDPENRGWEILEESQSFMVLRRTQTFNGTIQFGMLYELLSRANILAPKVEYIKKLSNGDQFDEYKVSWLDK